MTTRLLSSLLALGLLALPACKKTTDTTTPDDVVKPDPEPEPDPGPPPIPPQDPDPPEIKALYERLLAGDFEAVATEAGTLRGTLSGDTQIRANAMAGAIQALAAAESIPENAKEPAEKAVADGDRLADAEVQQLALIAHAAYLLGVQDNVQAQAQAEKAAALAGPRVGHAKILVATADLGQAFGTDEEGTEKLVAPEKLDSAYAAYEAAAADPSGLIQARAHEGMAEIDRQRATKESKAKGCEHAKQAFELYGTNGATEDLREGPKTISGTLKCKPKLK
ncbi:hypothetical protein ACNOYE_15495 [Nannocystaceae bacterium ST9]